MRFYDFEEEIIMWGKAVNLKAYSNVEQMSNYKTREELNNYRSYLLEKSKIQSDFIKSYFDKKIKVFEACSGNSRLLYRLYIDGILEEGVGVEISLSRVNFAQDWKQDFPDIKVLNICEDVIEYEPKRDYYDLAVCITGAFGYFYPINISYPEILLKKFNSLLRKDGYLLLELYQHVDTIKFCKMNDKSEFFSWKELPESDPFRFYLTKYTFYEMEKCLECKEIFIRRDGYIDDSKSEVLRIYSLDEIGKMIKENNFEIQDVFSDWDKKEYRPLSNSMIIMAKKK